MAAWAFLLGILLILLAAGSSEGETGRRGHAARDRPGSGPGLPAARSWDSVSSAAGPCGEDVRTLQQILGAKDYGPLVPHGTFDEPTEQAVKRFQRTAGLAVDGVVGPQTRPALVALMRILKATWYGPGFYGKRTACGKRLGRATIGVAHRTLPCGTRVTFYHGGRFVTVPVIDRGPFRAGRRLGPDRGRREAARLPLHGRAALRALRAPRRLRAPRVPRGRRLCQASQRPSLIGGFPEPTGPLRRDPNRAPIRRLLRRSVETCAVELYFVN